MTAPRELLFAACGFQMILGCFDTILSHKYFVKLLIIKYKNYIPSVFPDHEKNCLIFVTILSYNRFTILGMDIKVRILLPL